MSKRTKFDLDNMEGDEPLSMSKAADTIFGISADENRFDRNVLKIQLNKIAPDPVQPRRAVPKKARGNWRGEPDGIATILDKWESLAEEAIGETIDVMAMIDKFNEGKEWDTNVPYIALTFLELVGLAGSIKRDGLNSPITVTNRVAPHVIVTGERRFWAYCLLRKYFGDAWASIPAVISPKANVWQQGAENAKRLNLSAMDMARQIALLLMDMHTGDDGVMFNDITFFDHERDFYAQVADGVRYRIKEGYGQRVQDATGLKSRAQFSQYRALLRLSREHWDMADADGWTENYARQFVPREDKMLTGVNIGAPKKSERDLFIEGIGALLRHKIQRNTDALGLYAVGAVAMFVWWNQSRGGWEVITLKDGASGSRIVYDMPGLVGSMYDHAGAIGAWEEMTKYAFDLISKPSLPKTFAPMVAQGDDRGVFVEKMLAWLEKSVKGSSSKIGVMARTKDKWLFVNWEGAKYSYDERRFEGRSVKGGATGAIDDIEKFVGRMYDTLPYLDRWQMVTEDEFWAMMHPPKKSPTPQSYDAEKAQADIMGDDEDFVGDDVKHPFIGVDEDDPDYQAYLDDMGRVDEALEELKQLGDAYKESRQDTTRPPSDYPEPTVIAGNGLENALLRVLQELAEAAGDSESRHAATMVKQFTRKDVMAFVDNGRWEELSMKWYESLNGVMQKALVSMFDKLDKVAKS
jgi:hypothetical protein